MKSATTYSICALTCLFNVFLSTSAQSPYCDASEHIIDHPGCPESEWPYPTYFPHPNDCRKYYECSNGDAMCMRCAPETVWDQELRTCNHEQISPCLVPTTAPSTTTSTTQTPSTTEDPANWICPEGFSGLVGHPSRCTHFYECDPPAHPRLYECAPGLYYSPVNQVCDWPENVPSCQGGTPLRSQSHN